jgi:arylsulfatase A-like enzyme
MLILGLCLLQLAKSSDTPPPNIVVVFADDFAFDVGAFGAPTTLTPNMDRMSREGMRLTAWYSGENICEIRVNS